MVRLIGYWRSDTDASWPDPADHVDESWNENERRPVGWYLRHGTLLRIGMGFSPCRLCGQPNGSAEFTDGVYVWPEGLAHYVEDHSVRLPAEVIEHGLRRLDDLEQAEIDSDWWRSLGSSP